MNDKIKEVYAKFVKDLDEIKNIKDLSKKIKNIRVFENHEAKIYSGIERQININFKTEVIGEDKIFLQKEIKNLLSKKNGIVKNIKVYFSNEDTKKITVCFDVVF